MVAQRLRARPRRWRASGRAARRRSRPPSRPPPRRRSTSGPAGPFVEQEAIGDHQRALDADARDVLGEDRRTLRRRSAGPGAGAARWCRRPPWRLLSGRIRDPSTLTGAAVACRPCPPRMHRSMVSTARRFAAGRTRPSSRGRAPTPTTSTRPARSTRTSCAPRSRTAASCASTPRPRRAAPGVAGVFTGADLDLGPFPPRADGRPTTCCARCWRATSCASWARRSRSSSPRAARAAVDAAELVEVDIRAARRRRRHAEGARRRRAAAVRREGPNLAFEARPARRGRARRRRGASSRSRFVNQRLAAVPMEPARRRGRARPGDRRRAHLGAAAGAAHRPRDVFAGSLGLEKDAVRVTVAATSAAASARASPRYPEQVAVAALGAASSASPCATSRAAGRR